MRKRIIVSCSILIAICLYILLNQTNKEYDLSALKNTEGELLRVTIYKGNIFTGSRRYDGFINTDGEIVIPLMIDNAYDFKYGYANVEIKDKKGLINKSGEYVIEPIYEGIKQISGDIVAIKKDKWGIIGLDGTVYSECIYDDIKYCCSASEIDFFIVSKNGKYGLINKKNDIILDFLYNDIIEHSTNYFFLNKGSTWTLVNINTNQQIQFNNEKFPGYNNTFKKKKEELWGVIDKEGNWIVEPIYEQVDDFNEGYVALKLDGLWGYADSNGEIIIPHMFKEADPFYKGTARVIYKGKNWYIDEDGNFVKECLEDYTNRQLRYSEGLATFECNDKWGYLNEEKEVVIEPKYDYVESFSEGLAVAIVEINKNSYDQKYVYINTQGNLVIDDNFDGAFEFKDGIAMIEKGGVMGYIDKNGNYIWKP